MFMKAQTLDVAHVSATQAFAGAKIPETGSMPKQGRLRLFGRFEKMPVSEEKVVMEI